MIFFVLRGVIVVLALWVLWRLYTALFPARRPQQEGAEDEWAEVLEAIDELPETTSPHPSTEDRRQSLPSQPHHTDDAASKENLESVIVHEADLHLRETVDLETSVERFQREDAERNQ